MTSQEVARTADVLIKDTSVNFESLFLSAPILRGLHDYNLIKPSPIQLKAIPLGKCGFDLIVKSKSGTGKTAVFAIIALEMIDCTKSDLQVLVLAPTREIAVQSCDVIETIGKHINNLKVSHFIGGLPVKEDGIKAKDCRIAVGSPGRILHLIKSKVLLPENVKLLILDEADSLMNNSFLADINKIYHSLPKTKQMLAISATYPNELDTFLSQYMHSPTHVSPEMETPLLLGVKHYVCITPSHANVIFLTKTKNKTLLDILAQVSFTQCLVFCNYQTRAEEISNFLNEHKWKTNFISAAQSQKQRLEVLKQLKEFGCRILLSTDLTARGIDALNVDLVINYDVPNDASTYLHRMGRAGRYGSRGNCISLAAKGAELSKFSSIIGDIGGTGMSVPILKISDLPANIWEADLSSFECLNGTLNSEKYDAREQIVTSMKVMREEISNNVQTDRKSESDVTEHDDSMEINSFCEDDMNISQTQTEYSSTDETDPMEILLKLASDTHDKTTQLSDHKNTSKSSESICAKNVALLAVTSLLDADNIEDDSIELKLGQILTKSEEKRSAGESHSENIFCCAYDHFISKSNPNWADLYSYNETEESKCEPVASNNRVNLLQDLLEYVQNEEEPEYDYYEECDEDEEYDYGSEDQEGPSMQWVPVETAELQPMANNKLNATRTVDVMRNVHPQMQCTPMTNVSNEQSYEHLFDTAFNEFHAKFNTLETPSSYEECWEHLQAQLAGIRDYVQQNVYLDEMNAYRSSQAMDH